MRQSTVFIEGLFGSLLLNENGVVIPTMNEFLHFFWGEYVTFKYYVDKLVPILDFIPWKTTEYMGYDVI